MNKTPNSKLSDSPHEQEAEQLPQQPSRRTFIAAVSGTTIAAALLANYYIGSGSLALDIANEVTRKQLKNQPPEFLSSEYQDLGGNMSALPFRPIRSNAQELIGLKLIGGRYCSLKSQVAAQIHLVDELGIKQTLYQLNYLPERFGEIPSHPALVIPSRSKNVHIWQESGLLFALTRTAQR